MNIVNTKSARAFLLLCLITNQVKSVQESSRIEHQELARPAHHEGTFSKVADFLGGFILGMEHADYNKTHNHALTFILATMIQNCLFYPGNCAATWGHALGQYNKEESINMTFLLALFNTTQ
jgi:hypothetical protein